MRELISTELSFVNGGVNQPVCLEHSYYREFWDAYVVSAGAGAGYLSSPFVAVGMAVYGVAYYAIYTPIYYLVAGTSYVVGAVAGGVSSAASAGYHAVAG
jgi:hypothetical protein